jgi:hypothetical protein
MATVIGNNFSHSASRISNITAIAGDNMQMEMKNCLTGCRSNISPDIVTVGAVFLIQDLTHLADKAAYGCVFF